MAARVWRAGLRHLPRVRAVAFGVGTLACGTLAGCDPTWGVDTGSSLGPGCPPTRDRGYHAATAPGGDGWHPATGGDVRDGCNGAIVYTRVTGHAGGGWQDDFTWRFSPGIKDDGAYCNFLVHIPDSPYAAGRATYLVFRHRGAGQTSVDGFVVDQSRHHGGWFKSHVITVRNDVSTVDLVLVDEGTGSYTAADAATADCLSFTNSG